jgi:HEAT repeat protein
LSESFDEAVRAAFTGVLQREASAFETLYGLVRDAREDVRPAVLFAAAATGDCRASALFSRVLSVDPTLADVALAQARLLRRSPSLDANRDLANAARRYLYDAESRRRSAAARTLGELRDPASVPALCELLESGSRDLEESALWALRRISGLSLPPTRTAWTGWYERALASWERLRQRAPMRLADPRLAERHAIVSDLSSEQLFRDEAAMLLALATTDMDDRVCVAACRGLAQLDSPCAYASLIAARDRANERVAAAASEALQQIARRPLPTGADACRAALGI